MRKSLLFVFSTIVAMTVTACAQDPKSLEGKWIIETAHGTAVSMEDTAFIIFEEGLAQVHGSSGCNNFFGPCTVEGRRLKFGDLGLTRRLCPNAASESNIMNALFETVSYKVNNAQNTLIFYNEKKKAVMTLSRPCKPEANVAGAYENDVIKAIMERRSVRKYQDKPVPREVLQTLAECGVNAPSGMNRQQWQVRIVDNPDYIAGITEVYVKANPKMAEDASFKNMFRNAPAVIFVASPRNGSAQIDCGLLGENIMLAAQSLGLGTCCLGGPIGFMKSNPDAAPYVAQLALPDDYELLYAIAVGYPDESPEAKPRDISKIVFID